MFLAFCHIIDLHRVFRLWLCFSQQVKKSSGYFNKVRAFTATIRHMEEVTENVNTACLLDMLKTASDLGSISLEGNVDLMGMGMGIS